jgi:hypothetical protein
MPMNNLTKTLLGGVTLSALMAAPAMAGKAPAFHVTALYAGGKVVNKTVSHNPSQSHMTFTFGVTTHVPASDLKVKTRLSDTFYKWSSQTASSSKCGNPETKISVPKKSAYGKPGTATKTINWHCDTGPSVYYGDTYKLTDPAGEGKTDSFVSILIGKWQWGKVKYKGTLNLDVSVAIGADQAAENSN